MTLRARLREAGYDYASAGENIALAWGPIAAHFAIEHSPAHRRNVLGEDYSRVGIGVAFQEASGQRQAIVAQVFTQPTREVKVTVDVFTKGGGLYVPDLRLSSADRGVDARAAYEGIAQRRAGSKLPPMQQSEALEAIAEARLSDPSGALATDERVFAQQQGISGLSIESAEVGDLAELPRALRGAMSGEGPRGHRRDPALARGGRPRGLPVGGD